MTGDDRGLYSGLFENQHIIMLIYDSQTFNIVDANPAACQFYGYTHAQLTTLKVTDLSGWSLDRAAQELQRLRAGPAAAAVCAAASISERREPGCGGLHRADRD